MKKWTAIACVIVGLGGSFGLGCEEWFVGAPCTPETDDGTFTKELSGESYAIETRSSQCTGDSPMMCVTKTTTDGASVSEPKKAVADNPTACENNSDCSGEFPICKDNVCNRTQHDIWIGTQQKFSFCSCRCEDADGNKYDRNSDKYSGLCECPPNTTCKSILGKNIEDAPTKIQGSYCIPACIVEECTYSDQVCSPSSDSKEPWKWKCKVP
ncbi:MAG: hypothetical protein GY854_15565 [Deltaproteobacteria bacterium]|nr:hypothetical protein [Deltaproteobacteria bacterium]